jgi:hypothetical protein
MITAFLAMVKSVFQVVLIEVYIIVKLLKRTKLELSYLSRVLEGPRRRQSVVNSESSARTDSRTSTRSAACSSVNWVVRIFFEERRYILCFPPLARCLPHPDSHATGVNTGRHHPRPEAGCAGCRSPSLWQRPCKPRLGGAENAASTVLRIPLQIKARTVCTKDRFVLLDSALR